MKNKQIYIIDFDSTFTQVEALDELLKFRTHYSQGLNDNK